MKSHQDIIINEAQTESRVPRQSISSTFFETVILGDLTGVKRLIQEGCNINLCNAFNESALTLAIQHHHLEIIQFLLSHEKMNPRLPDDFPLLHAVRMQQVQTVQALLAHPQFSLVTRSSRVHLGKSDGIIKFDAVFIGNLAVIKLLVQAGIKLNTPDLIKCARNQGHSEVVSYLSTGRLLSPNTLNAQPAIIFQPHKRLPLLPPKIEPVVEVEENNCSNICRCC